MQTSEWSKAIPGGPLVRKGLRDLSSGSISIEACLAAIASPRLIQYGMLDASLKNKIEEPERELYRLLLDEGGDPYSRYNSLLRELVSFEQALDRRSDGHEGGETGNEKAVPPANAVNKDSIPPAAYEISRRLSERLGTSQVYLFGSYARGSAGPDSDLDFLVVVAESNKTRYQRAVEARYAIDGLTFPSDVIVLTREEWERELKAPCSLSSAVAREGITLHDVA